MATILGHNNKLTGGMCFFGSDECICYSFDLQLNGRLILHARKPYEGYNFSYSTLLEGTYLDITKLFEVLVDCSR